MDGQNLYRSAKTAFGYHYPTTTSRRSPAPSVPARDGSPKSRFYTGIPDVTDNAFWYHFSNAKFAQWDGKAFMFSAPSALPQ